MSLKGIFGREMCRVPLAREDGFSRFQPVWLRATVRWPLTPPPPLLSRVQPCLRGTTPNPLPATGGAFPMISTKVTTHPSPPGLQHLHHSHSQLNLTPYFPGISISEGQIVSGCSVGVTHSDWV